MKITGLPAALALFPWFLGLAICFAGGAWLATFILDSLLERILRSAKLYYEFLAFVRARVIQRRNAKNKDF